VIVVSNTSPLTNLAAIGQLDLLRQIHQRVIIAEAVFRELTADGGIYPGAVVQSLGWIETQPVANRLLVTALRLELDEGEAETIALAQELAADLVLMDERRGRAVDALKHSGFWVAPGLYSRVLQSAGE
jgi:hypothetical protein